MRKTGDCEDAFEFPVILGQGSRHTLTEDRGRVFGQKGARILVRPKARPIGFHLPRSQKD